MTGKWISVFEKLVFLLSFAVVLTAVILQGPRLFGMVPYVVLSGSMEPTIPAGSVLYCRTGQNRQKVGDIITYRLSRDTGGELLVTHRIVEIRDGAYVTKGDSNDNPDLAPVTKDQIIGSYQYHIPLVGYVLARLNGRLLVAILIWILCLNGLSALLCGADEPSKQTQKKERRAGRRGFLQIHHE